MQEAKGWKIVAVVPTFDEADGIRNEYLGKGYTRPGQSLREVRVTRHDDRGAGTLEFSVRVRNREKMTA